MKISTFTLVAGTLACNARCPFCIAKMTPTNGVELKEPEQINWRNFKIACDLAKQSGVSTCLITSKGEPTLFPKQITSYLHYMYMNNPFPIIEIQTNGIFLAENQLSEEYLRQWYDYGLSTIAISIVHYDQEKNRQLMTPYKEKYIDIPKLIKKLHSFGFSVRLKCTLCKDYIDNIKDVQNLINFASENKVEQLTLCPVTLTEISDNEKVLEWTKNNLIKIEDRNKIKSYLDCHGNEILNLPHGAIVYDVNGQNVCLTNCLTVDKNTEEMRQLIFFPDGHLRYSWQYPGAILL